MEEEMSRAGKTFPLTLQLVSPLVKTVQIKYNIIEEAQLFVSKIVLNILNKKVINIILFNTFLFVYKELNDWSIELVVSYF